MNGNPPGRNSRRVFFASLRDQIRSHWKILFAIPAWLAVLANIFAGIALSRGWRAGHLLLFLLAVYIVILFFAAWRGWESLVQSWRQRKHCSRFCHELLHGLPILVFFVSLTLCLEQLPLFHHFQNALDDTFMRGKGQTIPNDIFVAEITKENHDPMFANHPEDPLDPEKVFDLIVTVRNAGASVIGVDLDTCDAPSCDKGRTKAGWDQIQAKIQKDPDIRSKVIWAAVPVPPEEAHSGDTDASDREGGPPLTLNCVLGNKAPDRNQSGIVRFEQENGIVRKQKARFDVHAAPTKECSRDEAGFPAFYKAVTTKYKSENPPVGCYLRFTSFLKALRDRLEPTGGAYLSFPAEDLQRVQASEFVQLKKVGVTDILEPIPGTSFKRSDMVLIGGTYEASDNYLTPIGRMPGVELLADAIASDLNGSIIPAEYWPLSALLDALAGVIIMWIYFVWKHTPWALTLSLIGIVIALVLAWALLVVLRIWVNPIFVMAGMLAHQEYEAARRQKEAPALEDRLLADATEHETQAPD
jgi:CHASE2 domain-containing sensor protein